MKNVFLASFAAGTLAVVGVLGSAQAQSVRGPVPLTIELAPVADQAGRHQGKIAVTVTNNGSQVARVPTYQLPLKSLDNGILEVSRDGKPVDYTGRLVKRGLPKAADFTILQPGQSVQGEVDLAGAYDLSTSGNYTIQVRSSLQYASLSDGSLMKAANGLPAVATSTPLTVWLDGARRGVQRQLAIGPTAVVNGINYLNCSTTRTTRPPVASLPRVIIRRTRVPTSTAAAPARATPPGSAPTTPRATAGSAPTSSTSTTRWTRTMAS